MSDLDLRSLPSGKYGSGAIKGSGGDFGEQIDSNLHGKWYTAAKNGRVFIGALPAAGGIIPVNASGLVSTFSLWNPAGSGVIVELISYELGLTTATTVIGNIGLVEQLNVGSAIAVPGTLTAVAPIPSFRGAPAASAVRFYSALTHVGTPTWMKTLGICFAATTGAPGGPNIQVAEFDGKILLGPGTIISTAAFAAQTAAMSQSLTWAEWPA